MTRKCWMYWCRRDISTGKGHIFKFADVGFLVQGGEISIVAKDDISKTIPFARVRHVYQLKLCDVCWESLKDEADKKSIRIDGICTEFRQLEFFENMITYNLSTSKNASEGKPNNGTEKHPYKINAIRLDVDPKYTLKLKPSKV